MSTNNKDWELDDVQYGSTTSVPEPSTLLLTGLGFATLLGSRKRRLKSTGAAAH